MDPDFRQDDGNYYCCPLPLTHPHPTQRPPRSPHRNGLAKSRLAAYSPNRTKWRIAMKPRLYAPIASAALALMIPACLQATNAETTPVQIGEHLQLANETATLKTHSDGRHVFVTGMIGDKGPYNIIVDTGAGANVIDKTLAAEMGLAKTGEMEVLSGGVEPVTADVVTLPEMRVDGLTIENAEFLTMELAEMSLGQFHGVLGMQLFKHALITFDPRHERILVAQAELAAGAPGVIAFDASSSAFGVEIDAAGQQAPMVFDTGAPSSFTFPLALSETLPLQGELIKGADAQLVGGARSTWTAVLDGDIRLADEIYENPEITFMDPSAPHGTIGNAVLNDLVLRIDQKNSLLSLRAADAATKTAQSEKQSGNPRRLGIQLRGMGGGALTVARVMPGSLGEQAGFLAGDQLVELNGKPASDYDMAALGKLFKSAEPLHFVIDRDGEQRDIKLS